MIIFSVLFFFLYFFVFLKSSFIVSSNFYMDSSIIFMVFIFSLVFFLMKFSSFNTLSSFETIGYNFIIMFVLFFMLLCFTSSYTFSFLVYLENCVIFMVLFIFWFSKDSDKVSSTFFMFLINIFPSILFLYFCVVAGNNLIILEYSSSEIISILVYFSFICLLLSKLPLFFFHFWLTKAHVSASGSGSMILASLMLKIGSMGIFKFNNLFSNVTFKFNYFFFFFVSWTMILLLSLMSRFFDLKYLVACSSVVHMSPIFCVCLSGDSCSVYSSMLMMVGHGLVSYYIFFLVTLIYEVSYHRSIDFNKSFSSSFKISFFFLFLFFLMNMGFPPLVSFLSELLFLRSFYLFDLFSFLGFCFSLTLSGLVFFFVLSKSLFGKKNLMEVCLFSPFIIFSFYIYIFSFFFIPFIFF